MRYRFLTIQVICTPYSRLIIMRIARERRAKTLIPITTINGSFLLVIKLLSLGAVLLMLTLMLLLDYLKHSCIILLCKLRLLVLVALDSYIAIILLDSGAECEVVSIICWNLMLLNSWLPHLLRGRGSMAQRLRMEEFPAVLLGRLLILHHT